MEEKIIAGKNTVYLCRDGLNPEEFELLKEISSDVFDNSLKEWKHSLDRCTFFGAHGYSHLVKAVEGKKIVKNPRIEGCDNNPFDQHYWLGCDISDGSCLKPAIIDPIFGYVGLQESKRNSNNYYYKNKRTVKPDVSRLEGGIRMNTIGI